MFFSIPFITDGQNDISNYSLALLLIKQNIYLDKIANKILHNKRLRIQLVLLLFYLIEGWKKPGLFLLTQPSTKTGI